MPIVECHLAREHETFIFWITIEILAWTPNYALLLTYKWCVVPIITSWKRSNTLWSWRRLIKVLFFPNFFFYRNRCWKIHVTIIRFSKLFTHSWYIRLEPFNQYLQFRFADQSGNSKSVDGSRSQRQVQQWQKKVFAELRRFLLFRGVQFRRQLPRESNLLS